MQPTTPFLPRMKLRGYQQMAGQLRPTSVWPPMTSHIYQTSQSLPHLASDHLPILITINSLLSTLDGPRRTYINFKKADWTSYADACDENLAEAGES